MRVGRRRQYRLPLLTDENGTDGSRDNPDEKDVALHP
jgi:hypothetical protein